MLRFAERQEIDSLAALDDVARSQLRAAGRRFDGHDLPAEQRLPSSGHERALFQPTRSYGMDEAQHLYDGWHYNTDSGTIFHAGTTDIVAEIVQFGLQCEDRDARGQLGPALLEAGWIRSFEPDDDE